ncbi:MAG: hypothetical protein M1114_04435 [Candidatus Dependentiae bacterium]|nr:hypothetical protein [Candidatus Dependentiae bacterium]
MKIKIVQYTLALTMGLVLISSTMQTAEQPSLAAQSVTEPSVDVSDILGRAWERIKATASKTLSDTVEGLKPAAEKATGKLTETVTKAATEKAGSYLDLASTKVFDMLDTYLGKETFAITNEMTESASTAFKDLQSAVKSVDPAIVAKTLTGLSQVGTSAQVIAVDPVKLSNVLIELRESVTSFEKIEQVRRAIEAVAKLMKDAIEQSLTVFNKAYDKASSQGVFDTSEIAQQANEAIVEIRDQIKQQLSLILNK